MGDVIGKGENVAEVPDIDIILDDKISVGLIRVNVNVTMAEAY